MFNASAYTNVLNKKKKDVPVNKIDLWDPNTQLPTLEDVEAPQLDPTNGLWSAYTQSKYKAPTLKQQKIDPAYIPQVKYNQIQIDANGNPIQAVPQNILDKDSKLTQFWSGKINPLTGKRIGGYGDAIEGGIGVAKSFWDMYSAYKMGNMQEDALENQMAIDNENAYMQEENLLNTRGDRAEARARLEGKSDTEAMKARSKEEDKLKKNLKYLR
jgi:hypothetical protein